MSKSYENLNIWKESLSLVTDIYRVSKSFPRDELFGMTSQLRRAAVSVSSNIAEGSGRGSKKDYSRFIDMSIGSLNETENLLHIAIELRYLSQKEFEELKNKVSTLGVRIGAFKKYLNK